MCVRISNVTHVPPNVTYYFTNDFDAKQRKILSFIAESYNFNMGLKIGRVPQKSAKLESTERTH